MRRYFTAEFVFILVVDFGQRRHGCGHADPANHFVHAPILLFGRQVVQMRQQPLLVDFDSQAHVVSPLWTSSGNRDSPATFINFCSVLPSSPTVRASSSRDLRNPPSRSSTTDRLLW